MQNSSAQCGRGEQQLLCGGSALSPYLFLLLMDVLTEDVRKDVPGSMLFADGIVLCRDDETDMTEYLETWMRALENRGMRISRPNMTEYSETWRRALENRGMRISRPNMTEYSETWRRALENRGMRISRPNMTEYSETWRRALENRRMRISRPKTQIIDFNFGQTSSVVWCRDLGNNERTRSTTRSKWDEDAEMDERSDKEG